MPTLQRTIDFALKHLTAPDGTRFSLQGRDWLVNEIWRPICGAKLWPIDKGKLCDDCAVRAGKIVDGYDAADATRTKKHVATGCLGLTCEPQIIVCAHIRRQGGKTMGVKGLVLPRIFLDEHEHVGMLAGSEDQVKRLYIDHYQRQVANTPALAAHARPMGTCIITDKHSQLEIVPTTITAVGGTWTVVIVDECRVVPAKLGPAMAMTLAARGGWQCPLFHIRTHDGVDHPDAPKKCSVCGKPTIPWYGRALLLSSADEKRDTDQDWFEDFTAHFAAEPHPNIHVFRSEGTLNPKTATKVVEVIAEAFGAIDATREYAEIETGNRSLHKGQIFMGDADIKRCIDTTLSNATALAAPCVAFLDTSETTDKTSLVILADEAGPERTPWEYIYEARLDVWDPKELDAGVIPEKDVEQICELVLGSFAGMRAFGIDTRGRLWAIALCKRLKKKWRCVRAWEKTDQAARDAGWGLLKGRMSTRPRPTIRLQDNREQTRELKFAREKRTRDGLRVCDPNGNREKNHLDITESLSTCCYLIGEIMFKRAASSQARHIAERLTRAVPQTTTQRVLSAVAECTVGGQRFGGDNY
jgi:hypothetical protein